MNDIGKLINKALHIVKFKVRYGRCSKGKGSIIYDRCDCLSVSKNAEFRLNGNVLINSLRIPHNKRSSLLRMDENSTIEAKGHFSFGYGADIVLFKDSKLTLGANSYFNCDCKIRCHQEIAIGDGCAISHDVTIMDSNAHELNGSRYTKPVVIGDHVWIGTRVTILSGVTIGSGAVIAAGSIVSKDIPDKCLVGGVPARIIKENVEWNL